MSTRERWLGLVHDIQSDAVTHDRGDLSRGLFIDHYHEVTHPVTCEPGRGDGFSIFFGEYRIGWWATRAEACEDAEKFSRAIRNYPIKVVPGDV